MRNWRFLVLCVIGASLLVTLGAGGKMTKDIIFPMPAFRRATPAELDKQTDEAAKARVDIIAQLMDELRRPGLSNAAKVRVVFLLGQFRAVQATGLLMENISLEDKNPGPRLGTRLPRWSRRPARDALSKMGRYATIAIMRTIGSQSFQWTDIEGYIHVLIDVERPRYALIKLQDRMSKAKDEKARKQYQEVIARMKKLVPGMAK